MTDVSSNTAGNLIAADQVDGTNVGSSGLSVGKS
jgi:hypothetical protein